VRDSSHHEVSVAIALLLIGLLGSALALSRSPRADDTMR
jgi:hypothetical protein